MNILSMRTDNFKMTFETLDEYRYTFYTFGNSTVSVYLETSLLHRDESFKLVYLNNNKLKLSISSSRLPQFLSENVRQLYYGFLDYSFITRKDNYLACQVISCLRCVFNYCKRENIPFC